MKQLGVIFKYYYGCSWLLILLPLIGLLSLSLQLLMLLRGTSLPSVSFLVWSMVSLLFLAGIPFLVSVVNARVLLASRQLALLPGFQPGIGISLLLFALLISTPPALLAPWLLPYPISFLHVLVFIFSLVSAYIGIMQVVLGSRFNVTLTSYIMIGFGLLMMKFGKSILLFLFQPEVTACIFLLAVIGWCYAFRQLKTKNTFRLNPYSPAAVDDPWQNSTGFCMPGVGERIASPAGTLALGYPDGLPGRLLRLAIGFVLIPAFNMLFLSVINKEGENYSPFIIARAYLLICVVFAMLSSFQYSEMAAQTKTLWLRFSSDRSEFWKFIEHTFFQQLQLTGAMLAGIAAIIFSITDLPMIHLLSISMALIAMTYSTYLTLYCRIHNYKAFSYILNAIGISAMMVTTMLGLFNDDEYMPMAYLPSLVVQLVFLGLIFVLRARAKLGFSRIDWLQVKRLKKRSRNNLSYKN